ncbi:MAG TPA: NAD(P)-dependent oxidoreductase [Jiangellaceae bacterium]|nr:NAD(P)-dependent oxidoreductase [Jiangellaceae bacterium]
MDSPDPAPIATIAVVGLGAMGGRMAERLLAAYDVVVWNRTDAKTRPLVDAGARVATSPAAAAAQADAVISMVSDPTELRNVTEGPGGVLAGLGPESTLIEMSTVGPAAVTRLASLLPSGAGLLDAPVLGSIAEADAGTLRIFVGGPSRSVDHCRPVLSRLGTPIRVGPLGSGAAAKLVANATLFGVLGLLGEALALAQGLGLPRDVAFEVLSTTPLAEQARRRRTTLEAGDYPSRFALSLARKDADLVVDAARHVDVDLRLAAAARTWFVDADNAGLGGLDYTAVLGHIIGLSDIHDRSGHAER